MTTNFFSYSTTRTSARLGDNRKLAIVSPKNNFYMNSLFYKGIKTFNDLSMDIRRSQSISIEKKTFKLIMIIIYFNLKAVALFEHSIQLSMLM